MKWIESKKWEKSECYDLLAYETQAWFEIKKKYIWSVRKEEKWIFHNCIYDLITSLAS